MKGVDFTYMEILDFPSQIILSCRTAARCLPQFVYLFNSQKNAPFVWNAPYHLFSSDSLQMYRPVILYGLLSNNRTYLTEHLYVS